MPNRHATLTSLFDDIADAIRDKTGSNEVIKADDFDTAIEAIPTGGGGSDDYFYVEAIEDGTIGFLQSGTVDVALQYSFDKNNWTNYTLGSDVNISQGQKMYWKNNKNYLSIDDYNFVRITSSKDFNAGGRINSLINNIDGKGCYDRAFMHLFKQARLIDGSNLVLNYYVSNSCYSYMFQGCTLTTPPALPATKLATSCYQNMFEGCRSLTTAPALPATSLVTQCYAYMFSGCTSLTTAPSLPATSLVSYCYQDMFNGCTSLTTAPALPATELASYCYKEMFTNCTSLTTVCALPATTLVSGCYQDMFNGCTSLITVPALPATTLVSGSYNYMFTNCTSLKVYAASGEGHNNAWNIPSTGAITGTSRTMTNMFYGVETDSVPFDWVGTSGQQFTYYTQNTPIQ